MNLRCLPAHFNSSSSLIPCRSPSISRYDLRNRRLRRFTVPRCQFGLESFFNVFNSVPSLDLLAPVFGFASAAAAVYLHRSLHPPDNRAAFGEWILFTSPTPFNRCVLLRCPSISFEDGGEMVNSVNDRLMSEDRHYVNLSQGRIPLKNDTVTGFENDLKFQRVCVRTDDGGVISLDWPDYLNLEMERGLDTTVLIIPGTPEGSMDRTVKQFVLDIVKHGCFPIVMNPRGCAGSALTTPRLFTPADSDDVSTAVQFVNEIRPWTTLMGIGLGYGANMLTKYLAETGETTPVTAAVCIDTPFDLEESTKSSSHYFALNEKLTNGLREILRANKELFQGKTKGFNVAKALSATTVRDFDKAVSMISYGFDSLENFYRESCTRQLIGNLKIPTLFIQSDDGTVPLFSIPRSSITDNPFTSLLLCSCSHLAFNGDDLSALLWSQQIAVEWLSAVEHALLKGRHPLLNDVDITIKPSNDLAFNKAETVSATSKTHRRYDPSQLLSRNYIENADSFIKVNRADTVNGLLVFPHNTEANGYAGKLFESSIDYSKSRSKFYEIQRDDERGTQGGKDEKLGTDKDTETEDAEDVANAMNSGGSQVMQTATVIMNILEATMPGTLDDEHKKNVLSAMEQGETFMKALQGAVPEDVRGKITTSVTEIMQSQSINLNFEAVKQIGWIPNLTSELKSKIHEKIKTSSPEDLGSDDAILEQRKVDKSIGDESEENSSLSQEKDARSSRYIESGSEMEDNSNQSNKSDKAGDRTNENNEGQYEVSEKADAFVKKNDQSQVLGGDVSTADDSEAIDYLLKPSLSNSTNSGEYSSDASTLHQEQDMEMGSKNNTENSTQDVSQNVQAPSKSEESPPQFSSSKSHSVSVSQALDALTGFDNSTQMAVNSVFGVIENMIDQFEKSNQDVDEIKEAEIQRSVKKFNESPLINGEISHNFTCINNRSGIGQDLTLPATQPKILLNEGSIDSHEDSKNKLCYNKVKHSPASLLDIGIKPFEQEAFEPSLLCSTNLKKHGDTMDIIQDVAMKRYWLSPYAPYLNRYFTQLPNQSSLDLETATDLFLDPEEGQWKMIDQPSSSIMAACQNENVQNVNLPSEQNDAENAVEPSYVIPDCGDHPKCDNEAFQEEDGLMKEKLFSLIKKTLLDDLKVEACRRINTSDSKELDSLLAYDLESFTDKVSRAVVSYSNLNLFIENIGAKSVRFGTVEGQKTVEIILSALQDANSLREVLPFGVIVGTSLASLRTYFQLVALHDGAKKVINRPVTKQQKSHGHNNDIDDKHSLGEKIVKDDDDHLNSNEPIGQGHEVTMTVGSAQGSIIVGAVTAAFGASALLANHQKMDEKNEIEEVPSKNEEISYDYSNKSFLSDEEYVKEKNQNSLVSSLAEKAMSVAGPVMPTKGDGEVDHERLVAILAELGQKGGMLRFVGKIALLWGGIRGAMSLTDRLISFLHISKRPLIQRILGFVFMVLVLWSPVVIPLLPTLMQSWSTQTPNRIAEFACIVGFYIASMFLVVLWGKRIRGYDNPVEQYGLYLTSIPTVFDFLKGLAGGIMIVSCIHLVNSVLGYASISWTRGLLSSPPHAIVLLKAYGKILLLILQGIVSATGIAVVEELLFRSWLAEEVAADLGYYNAIMISGLIFALIQRSLPSVPGFLLLSISLFGIKQRTQGKLASPVGVRTGLMAANFVVQNSNLLSYRADTPFWLAGTHRWDPLDGAVGISLCAMLAIFFFPKIPHRPIQEYSIDGQKTG